MTAEHQSSPPRVTARDDSPVHVRMRLAALWTSVMFLYAYADIQHFVLQPGSQQDIGEGTLGGITLTQEFLFGAAVLMTVPAVMIALSVGLRATIARPLNIIVGAAYTLITLGTVVMPDDGVWWYYRWYNLVEVVLTVSVVVLAWRWPRASAGARAPRPASEPAARRHG